LLLGRNLDEALLNTNCKNLLISFQDNLGEGGAQQEYFLIFANAVSVQVKSNSNLVAQRSINTCAISARTGH